MLQNRNISDIFIFLFVRVGLPFAAIAIIVSNFHYWELRGNWSALSIFTILTIIVSFSPVRTFNSNLTLNNAVILSGILLLGSWVAVWSAILETIILTLLFRFHISKTLANTGQLLLTIWIVGKIQALLATHHIPSFIIDLFLIVLYWFFNACFVALGIAYFYKERWFHVFKSMTRSGTATYLLLMVMGGIGARLVEAYGIFSLLPLATVFITISIVFHQYFDNLNKLEQKVEEIKSFNHSFLTALAASIDARDPYTSGHSQRVAHWGREIANAIGLSKDQADKVYFGGILHDIGKIGIEDEILNKEGDLTHDEFERIKQHTVIGYDIVKQAGVFEELLPAVRSHHERIDGKGYPDGLRGEEIPLVARILAIADSFDAMVSNRPYRQGMPVEVALLQIEQGAGTQFDSHLAKEFIRLVKQIPEDELSRIIGQGGFKRQLTQWREAVH